MKIAIVGNGICGISAAKYISEDAPKERLTIFTDEEYHYYPRPRLIQLLSEKTDLSQLFPYNDEWFKNKNIKFELLYIWSPKFVNLLSAIIPLLISLISIIKKSVDSKSQFFKENEKMEYYRYLPSRWFGVYPNLKTENTTLSV
mgnify:CR=1 FL=1